jgi:hypothetical protein
MNNKENMTTEKLTKIEKITNDINEKFGVCTRIFKAGGRWSVTLEKGYNTDGKKMQEIREYVAKNSEELEDDDE